MRSLSPNMIFLLYWAVLAIECITFVEGAKALPPMSQVVDNPIYTLNIRANEDGTFSGDVAITFTAKIYNDILQLVVRGLEINECQVAEIAQESPKKIEYNTENGLITISLKTSLVPKKNYEVNLEFLGKFPTVIPSMSLVTTLDLHNSWPESTVAFPYFKEPRATAFFEMKLEVQKELSVINTLPYTMNKISEPGWVEYTYKEEKKLIDVTHVAYMVCLVKNQVTHWNKTKDVINVNIWASRLNNALRIIEKKKVDKNLQILMKTYRDLLKSKLSGLANVVFVPEEKAVPCTTTGLIVYGDRILLEDNEQLFSTFAVDAANLFFGSAGSIPMWLRAGLVNLFADRAKHIINDFQWQSEYGEVYLDWLALNAAAKATTSPVKAELVLRMLSELLGWANFAEGVGQFLDKCADFACADPENELWNVLNARFSKAAFIKGGADNAVKLLMDSWNKQVDYPMVVIKRNKRGELLASQKPFTSVRGRDQQEQPVRPRWKSGTKNLLIEIGEGPWTDGSSKSLTGKGKPNSCWWIPLSITTKQGLAGSTIMQCGNGTKPRDISVDPQQWYIASIEAAGNYRVNYDEANWELLTSALKRKPGQFDVLSCAQLVNDALELAWKGVLPYKIVLPLLNYLENEMDFLPWISALTSIEKIDRVLISKPADYQKFKEFMKPLMVKIFYIKIMTAMNRNTEIPSNRLDQLGQQKVAHFACKYGNDDCLEIMLSSEVTTGVKWLDYLRSVAYCIGSNDSQNHSGYVQKFKWEQFDKSEITERLDIITRLGCETNIDTSNEFIKKIIIPDDKIQVSDLERTEFFKSVVSVSYTSAKEMLESSLKGLKAAKESVKDSWKEQIQIYMDIMDYYTVTEEQRLNLKKICNDAKLQYDCSFPQATDNIRWLEYTGLKIGVDLESAKLPMPNQITN